MHLPAPCAVLLAVGLLPSMLVAQQSSLEIGLDGGMEYSFDAQLLTIAVPFQRVRAAFHSGERMSFEPTFSFTRVSSGGQSLAAFALLIGALYDTGPTRRSTYARPFAGIEYADASFADSETAFNLGVGFGTRSMIADQLAVRIEASITGRFGLEGGTDGAIGVTVGLSFFTK
jgi:hypothetical protein